jgi:hypothetical protein
LAPLQMIRQHGGDFFFGHCAAPRRMFQLSIAQ